MWSETAVREKRLKRLAERIEALTEIDDRVIQQTREIERMRRQAALELHGVCARFAAEVNRRLSGARLELDPPEYSEDRFHSEGTNLFQINIRGRIVQAEFQASERLVSTEEFRVPYILEGAVRCFNQDLLDREAIEEHLLFYCLEKKGNNWRFFDPRTYRTGIFDTDYLLAMMEKLV
jgi:hypothetical protein